jgi:uncharacterized membrane protein
MEREMAGRATKSYFDRLEHATSAVIGGAMLTMRPRRPVPSARAVLAGGALLAVGLRRRPLATAALALTGAWLFYRRRTSPGGAEEAAAREVQASITVGRPAEELVRFWRERRPLHLIMEPLADVTAVDGQAHWRLHAFGRNFDWDTEIVEERPGELLRWRSLPGAELPNEGVVEFKPAPGGRGTEVTLRFRIDSAAGGVGTAAMRLLGDVPHLVVLRALRRFKSLVETGEVPTIERQPAARVDTD